MEEGTDTTSLGDLMPSAQKEEEAITSTLPLDLGAPVHQSGGSHQHQGCSASCVQMPTFRARMKRSLKVFMTLNMSSKDSLLGSSQR